MRATRPEITAAMWAGPLAIRRPAGRIFRKFPNTYYRDYNGYTARGQK